MSENNLLEEKKFPSVMIDIETLGTGADAVILQVAAVFFDRVNGLVFDKFGSVVKASGQRGRVIDAETLAWWQDQDDRTPLYRSLVSEVSEHGIESVMWELVRFIHDRLDPKIGEVWTKGDMDCRILEHAIGQFEWNVPWKYWQVRDLRTVLKWAGVNKRKAAKHDAMDDAMEQVSLLFEAEEKRGGWPRENAKDAKNFRERE